MFLDDSVKGRLAVEIYKPTVHTIGEMKELESNSTFIFGF